MNINNRSKDSNIILQLPKIEHVILIWKTIKYFTKNLSRLTIYMVDIPNDSTIKLNDLKSHKKYSLKQQMISS